MTEEFITKEKLLDIIEEAKDDAVFCPHCFTQLKEVEGDDDIELYCPNEMCLFDGRFKSK